MLARNYTPFAAIGFTQVHRNGPPMAVVAVRASFHLSSDGRLLPFDEHHLVLADAFQAHRLQSSLLCVSDLVCFKPGTDISVIGRTYAPHGKSAAQWAFGISINDNHRLLQANGPRDWIPDGKRDGKPHWRMSEAKPVDFVPLDYRYAAGSSVLGKVDNDPHGLNPIGAYLLDPDITPEHTITPVAMIDSEQCPVTDPFQPMRPQGLSPIPPFWKQRADFIGTTDKDWQQTQFPNYPKDFDYRYYQSASRGLYFHSFLNGDETVRAINLTIDYPELAFCLPGIQPYAAFSWSDGRSVKAKLNLDGVHLDLRATKAPWKVDLTWRGWAAICPQFLHIDLFETGLTDPALADMVLCDELGLAERAESETGKREPAEREKAS